MAMLARAHALEAKVLVLGLMRTLEGLAERHLDWAAPRLHPPAAGQPVYLSHHLLAHFWKLRRDLQRFNFCLTSTDDRRSARARWPG